MTFAHVGRLTAFVILLSACKDNSAPSVPDCNSNQVNVSTVVVVDASSCTASDGKLTVSATGGISPYTYSLNGAAFQNSQVFEGLTAAGYQVIVQDSRGCTSTKLVTIQAIGSTLAATFTTTADTQCFPPHNGALGINPSGGTAPYLIKVGTGSFGSSTTFTGLDAGTYPVTVQDAGGCSVVLDVEVPQGDTGVSFASDIQPILNSFCNFPACHGAGNGTRSWTNYANVSASAQNIKLRTSAKAMPPAGQTALSDQQIQLIACWVDAGAKNN